MKLNIWWSDGPKSKIFYVQSYFRPRYRILEEFWNSKIFTFFTFVHYPRKCLLIFFLFYRVRIRGQQHVEANYKANVPNSTWKSTKNWCYVLEQKTCSSKLNFSRNLQFTIFHIFQLVSHLRKCLLTPISKSARITANIMM